MAEANRFTVSRLRRHRTHLLSRRISDPRVKSPLGYVLERRVVQLVSTGHLGLLCQDAYHPFLHRLSRHVQRRFGPGTSGDTLSTSTSDEKPDGLVLMLDVDIDVHAAKSSELNFRTGIALMNAVGIRTHRPAQSRGRSVESWTPCMRSAFDLGHDRRRPLRLLGLSGQRHSGRIMRI